MANENELHLLSQAESLLRTSEVEVDQASADMIAAVLRFRGGRDVVYQLNGISTSQKEAPMVVTPERTLQLAAEQYKSNRENPEYLAEFYQAFWNLHRFNMGISSKDIEVPRSPYTQQDLVNLKQLQVSELGFYLPQVVSTAPEGLILLGKAFPFMSSWSLQNDTTVRNIDSKGREINQYGWMSVEAVIDAPYTNTTEKQLRDIYTKQGKIGQTLNTYAASGQAIKTIYNQYPDELSTYVRLLSSRDGGRVVIACFDPDGCLFVDMSWGPQDQNPNLGGRSVGVKP